MDLDDCYQKGFIKKTRIDNEHSRSLIEMARSKEIAVQTAIITETTISAYVSLAYDSLREVLEVVCISKGYKVTSHICIGELLRSLDSSFPFSDFDRLRYIRNGINYYGTKIGLSEGKEIIRKTFTLKSKVIETYLSGFLN